MENNFLSKYDNQLIFEYHRLYVVDRIKNWFRKKENSDNAISNLFLSAISFGIFIFIFLSIKVEKMSNDLDYFSVFLTSAICTVLLVVFIVICFHFFKWFVPFFVNILLRIRILDVYMISRILDCDRKKLLIFALKKELANLRSLEFRKFEYQNYRRKNLQEKINERKEILDYLKAKKNSDLLQDIDVLQNQIIDLELELKSLPDLLQKNLFPIKSLIEDYSARLQFLIDCINNLENEKEQKEKEKVMNNKYLNWKKKGGTQNEDGKINGAICTRKLCCRLWMG